MDQKTHQAKIHSFHSSYLNELFYNWFVRYNPLYFVSAACFIVGVLLVSKGIHNINWIDGQIILTGVIETYQLLLLAGSFILYRILSQTRPAVILAIMNIVFLFDCTYQTEHLSSVPYIGDISTALWIVLFVVKLKVLTWIFRLKLPLVGFLVPIFAALGVAATPYFLYYTTIDAAFIHLAMTWYGVALAILFLWSRPTVLWRDKLDEHSKTVLLRIANAAWMIWAGFFLFHLISWIRFFDIDVNMANIAPVFILLPFILDREELVWAGCIATSLLSLANPSYFWINAILVAVVLCINGWRNGRPRLYIGAIWSLHFALAAVSWHAGPFPEPAAWVHVMTAIFLIATGCMYRSIFAFITALIWIFMYWKPQGPEGIMQWGALFIAIGFATLIAGIFFNWKFRFAPSHSADAPTPSPVETPGNGNAALDQHQATDPRIQQTKLGKDLNGFCPYCNFHLNAGKGQCDKCGKKFY
jgi:hypothetical protein